MNDTFHSKHIENHCSGSTPGRRRRIIFAGLALFMGMATAPLHAGTLSLRLVEAHNDSDKIAPGLKDVSGTLRKNLNNYRGFDLMGSKSLALPAEGSASLGAGFSVKCSGPQKSLTAVITRNRQQVLSTTLNLRTNTPVILGGFTSKRGRMLVLLVAR